MRHSHATHDLVNHIADGDFPEWDFCIQTMELSEEHSQDFDPLDCTKVIIYQPQVLKFTPLQSLATMFWQRCHALATCM